MSKRTGGRGGSTSSRSAGAKNVVKVSGYTRSNGTYVAGYTRSAPRYKVEHTSCNNDSTSESETSDTEDNVVYVKGYTLADGTCIPGYIAPQRKACDKIPTGSSYSNASKNSASRNMQADRARVPDHFKTPPQRTTCSKSSVATSGYSSASNRSCSSGYTPVQINGTKVSGYAGVIPGIDSTGNFTNRGQPNTHAVQAIDHTRLATGKAPGSDSVRSNDSSISSHDSGIGVKCYVDNAYNRWLGRVGKPLRTCIVRDHSVTETKRSRTHKKLLGENKLEDLVQAMKGLQTSFSTDYEHSDYQYAIDRLQRDEVEESWKENFVEPSRSCVTSLQYRYPESQIPFADLKLEKVIGRGGFGEVYAGRLLGKPVAFKKLFYQQMSLKWKKNFSKEVSILATTDHSNIVKMLGYVDEENNIGIVMEYLRCSLFRAIFVDCSLQDISKKKVIISQVACALNYLHTHDGGRIAHCDIKSENVLLDWNDNALLCDFGLSALKNTAMSTQSSVPGIVPPRQGTPRYSAPEVLRGELLTMTQLLQADIYSLAIVVFEVMTEEEPFEGLNLKQLETNVGHGYMRPTSGKLTQPLDDLLTRCWDNDAAKRLSAAEFQEAWNYIAVV